LQRSEKPQKGVDDVFIVLVEVLNFICVLKF